MCIRDRLLTEYKTARTEAQEYDTVKQNVDTLLAVPKEQEQQRRHELEMCIRDSMESPYISLKQVFIPVNEIWNRSANSSIV